LLNTATVVVIDGGFHAFREAFAMELTHSTHPKNQWRFLCDHHRHLLEQDVAGAKQFWGETVLSAREKMAQSLWRQALTTYGNAWETATILLHRDTDRSRAELRYSRTVAEFIYALRRVQNRCDANLLYQIASCELEGLPLTHIKQELMEPLVEAIACDYQEAADWINELPRMSEKVQSPIH
tara:strand:- start:23789 stop:24334 length:546 start_codon:yes stop_codon:yes gene_type:complete